MIKAACMNTVPMLPPARTWLRCGWIGDVPSLDVECPHCLNRGRLAPVIDVPRVAPSEGSKVDQWTQIKESKEPPGWEYTEPKIYDPASEKASGALGSGIEIPIDTGYPKGGPRKIFIGDGETRIGLLVKKGTTNCVGIGIRDGDPATTIGTLFPAIKEIGENDVLIFFTGIDGARVLQDSINHAILSMYGRLKQTIGVLPETAPASNAPEPGGSARGVDPANGESCSQQTIMAKMQIIDDELAAHKKTNELWQRERELSDQLAAALRSELDGNPVYQFPEQVPDAARAALAQHAALRSPSTDAPPSVLP